MARHLLHMNKMLVFWILWQYEYRLFKEVLQKCRKRSNPWGGACGSFVLASAITFQTGIQGINPAVGFAYNNGQPGRLGGIIETLRGEPTF